MKDEIEKISFKIGQIEGILHALQMVMDVPIDGCAKERLRTQHSAATLIDLLESIAKDAGSVCVEVHEASRTSPK